jgi:Fe-S-cluster containining protein
MEFEIDTKLVAAIVSDEMRRTQADLAAAGPIEALARSQRRHDARLAAAADAPTLACKSGCFWCCYFTVDARPVEIVRIVEFMERELPTADRERIESEIRANAAALASLDPDARSRHNLKCPFLHLGRCSIYAVRPQTCRNYHATNAAGCEQAYKEPENDDIDPEFAPLVYQSGGAHVDAFSTVLKAAGYDVGAYELSCALAVALADPQGTRARLEATLTVFPQLEGVQVLPEFIDDDH